MRFVAAFGIVWAHIGAPGQVVGYAALALFIILTAVLTFGAAERYEPASFLASRMRRLFLPWLGWSAFYLLLEAWRAGDLARLWSVTDWRWLMIGPVIHLWFLPFVLLATPLTLGAMIMLRGRGCVWIAVLPAAASAAIAIRLHDVAAVDAPFIQWCFSVTPLFYGILAAAARRHDAWPAPLVFIVCATLPPWLLWGSVVAPWFLSSALLFEAFWRADIRAPLLPALGSLAYGIYLLHPFFMLVWYRLIGPDGSLVLAATLVFIASACAAVGINFLTRHLTFPAFRLRSRAISTATISTRASLPFRRHD